MGVALCFGLEPLVTIQARQDLAEKPMRARSYLLGPHFDMSED